MMNDMKKFKCTAGFLHFEGEECGHIASQRPALEPRGFELPDDYYSPEATAARRAENKLKYGPGQRRANRYAGITSTFD